MPTFAPITAPDWLDLLQTLEATAAQPPGVGTSKQAASRSNQSQPNMSTAAVPASSAAVQQTPPAVTFPAWLPKLAMAVAAIGVAIALFYWIHGRTAVPTPVNQPVETNPAQTSPVGNSGSSSPREPTSFSDTNDRIAELLKQAMAGNSTSMVDRGYAYHQGDGVSKDYQLALEWYRKGAEAGNAQGMYNMGVNYERGYGLPIDYAAAVSWYTKAAEAGDGQSRSHVSRWSRRTQKPQRSRALVS